MRKLIVLSFTLTLVFLVGCSDSFVEKAKETQGKQVEDNETEDIKSEQELENFYKEYEKPISDSLQENDLDELEEIEKNESVSKQINEKDPESFAQYVAAILFSFENGELKAEQYYEFLSNYGSDKVVADLPKDKHDGVHIFESIQELYKESNPAAKDYTLSKLQYSQGKVEAYFYRKVLRDKKEEFYITTIVKEDGIWKFSDDSPSAPYIEQ
ncbi:hypothetical protein [Terribacillus sp. DMT04]|uniref:hypothetical protein n=1 Tax=Terribacillus sp. DMT04 TaxID=2850441 RepID=UPI001C2CB07E|nr:hypothetical protein [Terribacillus sp. DMT04]QXE03524.1 hypothetical protein KS242_17745 [Terribacillus sp. DMT04]